MTPPYSFQTKIYRALEEFRFNSPVEKLDLTLLTLHLIKQLKKRKISLINDAIENVRVVRSTESPHLLSLRFDTTVPISDTQSRKIQEFEYSSDGLLRRLHPQQDSNDPFTLLPQILSYTVEI